MALKAVHVTPDVITLDQVPENTVLTLSAARFIKRENDERDPERKNGKEEEFRFPHKFVVIGHRGSGMNVLQSGDRRKKSIKENSIRSFEAASKFPLDFVEFDVQVTKDGCLVIFHDIFILCQHEGTILEKTITEITLAEFLSHGQPKSARNVGKPLLRRSKDGRIFQWMVDEDDPLCTLQEVFEEVDHALGFNIEVKFDDRKFYKEEELTHVLQAILQVVFQHAKGRLVIFSSFHPDAAQLIRKLQRTYPVFFLTNGGCEISTDVRRNSLDEAIKVITEGGLQGIVSEVKAVLGNPEAVTRIKESKLPLITYGQLNNVNEVVQKQYLMGIEGVIVDLVQEITETVSVGYNRPRKDKWRIDLVGGGKGRFE